ncbi:MAG: ribulose-phosphate 3-epimerase [Ignavibacteriales bacterium]|nr:ribulose-phosphate 3-epimerase [Ignavibacteriales bacterium]
MIKIAPSVLSADFSILRKQIILLEKGGADWIHLDIMDGHFVPNLTFGSLIIKSIRSITKLPLDAHLMAYHPERYIDDFKKAGVDLFTVHIEACVHLHRVVQRIKESGMKAGVSLNPSTPAISLREIIPSIDQILVMTVNPGFGGQKFIKSTLRKIREIAIMIESSKQNIELEVDGGVDEKNAKEIVNAGATVLIAGYSIFSKKNISIAVKNIRIAATK